MLCVNENCKKVVLEYLLFDDPRAHFPPRNLLQPWVVDVKHRGLICYHGHAILDLEREHYHAVVPQLHKSSSGHHERQKVPAVEGNLVAACALAGATSKDKVS